VEAWFDVSDRKRLLPLSSTGHNDSTTNIISTNIIIISITINFVVVVDDDIVARTMKQIDTIFVNY